MTSRTTVEGLLAGAIFAVAAFADAPKALKVAGMTGLALTSAFFLLAGLVSLLANTPTGNLFRRTRPLWLFLLWAALSAVFMPPTSAGFQNLVLLAGFPVIIVMVAKEAQRDSGLGLRVVRYGQRMAVACSVLFLLNTAAVSVGFSRYMFPRQFSLAALVGLACLLADKSLDRRSRIRQAVALVMLVGFTQSRMCFAIGVFLVAIYAMGGRRRAAIDVKRVVVSTAGAMTLVALLAFNVPALHDRFFGGYKPIEIGGLEIASSGRATYWQATIESWVTSPWVGHGAGSASTLIDTKYPGIGHPLNEYLRLLHDYGLVGTALWVWGLTAMLRSIWKSTNRDSRDPSRVAVRRAAVFGLLSLFACMISDNPLVYFFVMGPMAVIVGCAIGSSEREPDPEDAVGVADGHRAPSELVRP